MSLDKIRNNKISRPSQTYSRNPIINNLIRNKLQTQMATVKDNVASIIKKQQLSGNLNQSKSHMKIRRQKSYTLTPKKINQSLEYDPIQRIQNLVQQFVTNKQLQSYLISKKELQGIHKARQQPLGLNVKFKKSDQIQYEKVHSIGQIYLEVKNKTKNSIKGDVWFPDKPEIINMVQDRFQLIEDKYTSIGGLRNESKIAQQKTKFKESILPLSKNKTSLNLFKPPLASFSNNQKQKNFLSIFPTQYNTNRYHKDDYKSIEIWFEENIKKLAEQVSKNDQKQCSLLNQQLDIIYALYLSAWKEMIRLTYIQSNEKGLLFQKLLYSMLRLFSSIVEQQQLTMREYINSREQDVKNIKQMLEQRCDMLNQKYQINLEVIQDLKNKNHRLSLSYISFQKINKQMINEIQNLSRTKKKSESEMNAINRAYVRALEKLSEKGFIQVQIDKPSQNKHRKKKLQPQPTFKTYYMIGNDNKPMTLGRFKYTESAVGQYAKQNQQIQGSEQMIEYNKKINQLQNQINRFWSKKQDDLQLKGTINSCLINIKICDASTGTLEVEPINFGCQFPDSQQNLVEKLLDQQKMLLMKQFEAERQKLESQLQQRQALLDKWRSNNELNNQKIKNLNQNLNFLNQSLKKQKEANQDTQKQIIEKTQLNIQLHEKIEQLQKNKLFLENEVEILKQRSRQAESEADKINKLMHKQKQNNNYLVRSNLKAQQLAEKQKIRHSTLLEKVKAVAPYLQQFIQEVQRITNESEQEIKSEVDLFKLNQVCNKIQLHLGEYVEKDSGLFNMTKI